MTRAQAVGRWSLAIGGVSLGALLAAVPGLAACASSLDVQPSVPDGGARLACTSQDGPCPITAGSAGVLLSVYTSSPIANAASLAITTLVGTSSDGSRVQLPSGGVPPEMDVWLRFVPGVSGPLAVTVTALDATDQPIRNAGDTEGGLLLPDRSIQVQLWLR